MKTVLTVLNAQYVHMALAPWYLKAACADVCTVEVREFTINRDNRAILRSLVEEQPDVLGFCTYLFNIEQVYALASDIKKLLPDTVIVFGGPEAGNDPSIFQSCPDVDYVVRGEGETPFRSLLLSLRDKQWAPIPGIATREHDCEPVMEPDLDALSSPYTDEMLAASAGRILYYEASRGCPFRCSYCLSSLGKGARFFSLDRVRAELARVLASPARQVKFVDRTFNCRLPRAKAIVRMILELAAEPAYFARHIHFEVAADLFDDELIRLFNRAPAGLFQLEIGIQSFYAPTLAAVHRASNLERCVQAISRLRAPDNVHIHADLIAGLPLENYATFSRSFNMLYALAPHDLQLGFLKLLKGAEMRGTADRETGYLYGDKPPYQVLRTPWISYSELEQLEDIAFCVERLHNSSRFTLSLPFLVKQFPTPFAFFDAFAQVLRARGCLDRPVSYQELCAQLLAFADARLSMPETDILRTLMRYDFFLCDNSCNPPRCLPREAPPDARTLYAGQKGRQAHFERFPFDPVVFVRTGEMDDSCVYRFDYTRRHPVTDLYTAERIALPG